VPDKELGDYLKEQGLEQKDLKTSGATSVQRIGISIESSGALDQSLPLNKTQTQGLGVPKRIVTPSLHSVSPMKITHDYRSVGIKSPLQSKRLPLLDNQKPTADTMSQAQSSLDVPDAASIQVLKKALPSTSVADIGLPQSSLS